MEDAQYLRVEKRGPHSGSGVDFAIDPRSFVRLSAFNRRGWLSIFRALQGCGESAAHLEDAADVMSSPKAESHRNGNDNLRLCLPGYVLWVAKKFVAFYLKAEPRLNVKFIQEGSSTERKSGPS